MKKGKLVWALTLWFLWAVKKDIEVLYRHQTTADYFAYTFSNVTPLFFVLVSLVLILNLGTVFFLFRPKPIGLKVAYSALIAAVIYSLVTFALGLQNIEGMKQAYILSRKARGLSVQGGSWSAMFSVEGFVAALFLSLLFYCLMAYLITARKSYFKRSNEFRL